MSKSLGNYIGVTDEPFWYVWKSLSISDNYVEILWIIIFKIISWNWRVKNGVNDGSKHPKKVKEELAMKLLIDSMELVKGVIAKMNLKSFCKKDIPTDMPEFEMESGIWICQALVDAKLVDSTSQARRDIKANAVSINQEKLVTIN